MLNTTHTLALLVQPFKMVVSLMWPMNSEMDGNFYAKGGHIDSNVNYGLEKKLLNCYGAGHRRFFFLIHLFIRVFFNWCLGNRIHQTHRYQGRHGDFIGGLGKFHAPTLLIARFRSRSFSFSPLSFDIDGKKWHCNDWMRCKQSNNDDL